MKPLVLIVGFFLVVYVGCWRLGPARDQWSGEEQARGWIESAAPLQPSYAAQFAHEADQRDRS